MPAQLKSFLVRENRSLQVFCPNENTVITSFENYLPPSHAVGKISGAQPTLPGRLCWLKENHDYYAYLPKDRSFDGHLLASLKHHTPRSTQRDGRWYVDDETRELWRSLDINITKSINVIGRGLLVELEHYEPQRAVNYGFAHGHKNLRSLQVSLEMSRNAFVHRLAYLVYVISLRYRWDQDLVDQEWWRELGSRCSSTWVDSMWDVIYRQWETRNFVGLFVKPTSSSVRWLKAALSFGVPIWVLFPHPECYSEPDGGFVMKQWKPPLEQVMASRQVEMAKSTAALSLSEPLVDQPPELPADLPAEAPMDVTPEPLAHSQSLSPPAELPENARWYESWEVFFREREEAYTRKLKVASEKEKRVWESRARNAKGFNQPGRAGAHVYVWESCDSGGFFRILQTRFEVSRDWEYYFKEALVFDPRGNIWDHCPFMWQPAIEDGPPDDLDDEDGDRHIMEHWYTEPALQLVLPDDDPSPLDFLYVRYGFLEVEPTAPPEQTLPFDKASAYRIVGLETDRLGEAPKYLNPFLTDILQGRLPAGHCDLSLAFPDDTFSPSGRKLISDVFFYSQLHELSEAVTFVDARSPQLLVVHDSLSVLQMVRAGAHSNLRVGLQYLLHNGSRLTLLYPRTQPPLSHLSNILTFPIRNATWTPNVEDFRAYMSRLKTFFLDRPYISAAAFSRGGIAWRIAREVIGIEGSVEKLLDVYPDQTSRVSTSRGDFWFHEPDEGEWFYLVGGYEILTGLCFSPINDGVCSLLIREGRSEKGPFMVAQGYNLGRERHRCWLLDPNV